MQSLPPSETTRVSSVGSGSRQSSSRTPVECNGRIHHLIKSESLFESRSPSGPHLSPQGARGQKLRERCLGRSHVTRRDEQAGSTVVDRLRTASDIRGEHRE